MPISIGMDTSSHTVPALVAAVIALAVAVIVLATRGGDTEPTTFETALVQEAFSEQAALGRDSAAKSDARNAVSELESCYVTTMDYAKCELPTQLLEISSGPGQVEVAESTPETYTIVAHSETGSDFTIVRAPRGLITRPCAPAGEGGCPASGDW